VGADVVPSCLLVLDTSNQAGGKKETRNHDQSGSSGYRVDPAKSMAMRYIHVIAWRAEQRLLQNQLTRFYH
jgi:hypothetical protein